MFNPYVYFANVRIFNHELPANIVLLEWPENLIKKACPRGSLNNNDLIGRFYDIDQIETKLGNLIYSLQVRFFAGIQTSWTIYLLEMEITLKILTWILIRITNSEISRNTVSRTAILKFFTSSNPPPFHSGKMQRLWKVQNDTRAAAVVDETRASAQCDQIWRNFATLAIFQTPWTNM